MERVPTQRALAERAMAVRDQWAEWLLHRRHGGDPEQLRRTLEFLGPIRDRVIKNARLSPGDIVLDVGAGDGLIGFAALDAVAPNGRVIFDEISADLLEQLRRLAADAGVSERCDFVLSNAESLGDIPDQSVDAVTMRSVLIYVSDKAAAFQAFHRVLRHGGRLSMFEPINRFSEPREGEAWGGYDVRPVKELYDRVMAVYRSAPSTPTMLDFDERTLFELAEQAGFTAVKLRLEAESGVRPENWKWDQWMKTSPNPLAPTGAEAVATALSADEATRFAAYMRAMMDSTPPAFRSALAYLHAIK